MDLYQIKFPQVMCPVSAIAEYKSAHSFSIIPIIPIIPILLHKTLSHPDSQKSKNPCSFGMPVDDSSELLIGSGASATTSNDSF